MQRGCFQPAASVNGHLPGFPRRWIASGIDQTELIHSEVCAQPCNAADVQRACRLNQDNDNQSTQLVEMAQQISHGLRSHLETWHRRCVSADDLTDQVRITHPLIDAHQLRCQQSLTGEAMASSAIDAKQLASMVRIPLKFQGCLDVRILLSTVDDPDQQHSTSGGRQYNERRDQTAAAVALFCCS